MSDPKKRTELELAVDEARCCLDGNQHPSGSLSDAGVVGCLINEVRQLRWYRDHYTTLKDSMSKMSEHVGYGDVVDNVRQLAAENARLKEDLNTIGLVMVREKIEAGKTRK